MIQLYQLDWSPFCIVQRRILEYAGIPFRTVEVSMSDREGLWKLTKGRYYQVPVIKDGRQVVFETGPDTQVIAKYLDSRYSIGLFAREWDGLQEILWRYFENDIEDVTFRLNDIHWKEFVPASQHAGFVRHKERKFGRGCIEEWRARQGELLERLERLLSPVERMLTGRPYLLTDRPQFVDFCLFGMLGNFLYSGHYELPAAHARLRDWHGRMAALKKTSIA